MEFVEIVTLDPHDWQQYKTLRLQALQEDPQAFSANYENTVKAPDSQWQERVKEAQRGKSQWLLFAKVDEKLIGMVGGFIHEDPTIAHVGTAFVTKEERGKGIGALLMQDLIKRIKQKKHIKKMEVEVNSIQEAAVRLYKNCGFTVVGKQKRVLGDEKEYEDFLMELPLPQSGDSK